MKNKKLPLHIFLLIRIWEFLSNCKYFLRWLPFYGKYFRPGRVRRYIKPTLALDAFFEEINRRKIRYLILRWFEDLPFIAPGEDIDLLVHEEDLPKVEDLLWPFHNGIMVDIYTVDSTCNYNGVSYYPEECALELLQHRVLLKGKYYVPDKKRHFLSLAYHAAYHKHEGSGIPIKDFIKNIDKSTSAEHPYRDILEKMGRNLSLDLDYDLEGLHSFLDKNGWAPTKDIINGLVVAFPESLWLSDLQKRKEYGQNLTREKLY